MSTTSDQLTIQSPAAAVEGTDIPAGGRKIGGRGLIGGAAVAIVGRVGYVALSYFSLIAAARILHPAGFGLYQLAVAWVTSLTLMK